MITEPTGIKTKMKRDSKRAKKMHQNSHGISDTGNQERVETSPLGEDEDGMERKLVLRRALALIGFVKKGKQLCRLRGFLRFLSVSSHIVQAKPESLFITPRKSIFT